MTFFTSDQHLGHKNIIRLCNRPFKTLEEMKNVLVERWNASILSIMELAMADMLQNPME